MPDGKIITIASNGSNNGVVGDSEQATAATLGYILAFAKDKKNNLFLSRNGVGSGRYYRL